MAGGGSANRVWIGLRAEGCLPILLTRPVCPVGVLDSQHYQRINST